VTAVAVFAFAPSADELLDHRVAQGWEPTPTSTVDGDVIMGHACKRFGRCPPEIPVACGPR
jgi:hypothetical protein